MGVGAARESAKMRDRRDAPDAPSAHTRNRKDRREGFVEPRTGPSGRLLTSYQTLHEIARMLLGSASQEELLTTITRELKRLVPYDIVTIYQIDHVQGMFVPLHVVDRFEKHLDDHPFELGTGFTGQAVRSRRPLNLPRADLVAGGFPGARHRERPRVAGHRAADGARRADRHAQRVPPGRGRGLLRRGVRSDLPVCRPRRPRPRQHAAPRPAGQGSPDRRPDRPREPPGLPRAAAGGGRAGAPVPAASIAGRVRSRRLQAAERRPRPSAGRRRAVGGCGCRLRGAPGQRRGLSGGRRGVRDPAAGEQQARCQGRRRPFVQPGACTRHRAPDDRVLRRCGFPRRRCEPDGAAGGG